MGSSRLMLVLLLYFGSGFGGLKCGSRLLDRNTWADPEFGGRCDWMGGAGQQGKGESWLRGLPI